MNYGDRWDWWLLPEVLVCHHQASSSPQFAHGKLMKTILQTLTAVAITLSLSSYASADIILTLTQDGAGVTASWSGSGAVNTGGGGNPGGVLEFRNLTGSPFASAAVTSLSPGLAIGGLDNGATPYANIYDELEFAGVGVGTSDLIFRGPGLTSIQDGFTYNAVVPIPPATITGLLFADLNVGSYTASNTSGDASDFGGFTLNIVSATPVPEPSTFIGVGLLAGLGFWARRRKTV